jgi:hypothetical protein
MVDAHQVSKVLFRPSGPVCLVDPIVGELWDMWTAEQARQYVAEVAHVPADDLQRLYLPGKTEFAYCFLQDHTDTTHVAHFRRDRDKPLVVMLSAS